MAVYERIRPSLRYWLLGRNYIIASKALDFAEARHTGLRKDGETPEFQHQIEIAHFVRTLEPSLLYPELSLAVAFLHDVIEDKPVTYEEIESRFGKEVAKAVDLLSKFRFPQHGMEKADGHYYGEIGENPIASIVKGADRIHNIQSMPGVFTVEKQKRYIAEVETFILPMLKRARKTFPEQELAYHNIKHMLVSQIYLIRKAHEAAGL